MDKSKEYCLMCSKAGEIQESWVKHFGDFFAYTLHCDSHNSFLTGTIDSKNIHQVDRRSDWEGTLIKREYHYEFRYCSDAVWLPRQDQLQEMIELDRPNCEGIRTLTLFFYKFTQNDLNYVRQFSSMEQLWLAFVMKEKFNKVWNGKEWIVQ